MIFGNACLACHQIRYASTGLVLSTYHTRRGLQCAEKHKKKKAHHLERRLPIVWSFRT